MAQDDLRPVIATGSAACDVVGPELLGVGVDDLEAEVFEERERGLLDEILLGEAGGRHAASAGRRSPRSMSEISRRPVTTRGRRRSRVATST